REISMGPLAEYGRYDATGLADHGRRRQISPGELLDAAIARVEARNGAVNAVTMPLYDYGRAAIAQGLPDGPFTGVPFLMKDLTASIAGVPMTRSSRFFADAPAPTADSEHVARLKRAGLVIFGRTNTCELGLSLTCEPRMHGPTRNPWDPTRISGGSSGGARRRHAADGARDRRLRLDPCAGGLLRPRGPQAHARAQHDGARARRGTGRLLGRARRDLVGARFRRAARRDQRPGRRRSLR